MGVWQLLYRTLRDMNLSKLVAQDVPLFLSMLQDVFANVAAPKANSHPALSAAIQHSIRAVRTCATRGEAMWVVPAPPAAGIPLNGCLWCAPRPC